MARLNLLKLSNLASHARTYEGAPARMIDAAAQLLELTSGSRLAPRDAVVFSPRKWAYRDASTPLYTSRLRLAKVRTWINDHFGS